MFGEALRLGADLADELEAKVSAFGRWLLEAVFANEAAAALDDKTKNPVRQELVRRAGGPTLRISKHMLYVAVRLAAYDKRITDQTWRGLDPGRKVPRHVAADDRAAMREKRDLFRGGPLGEEGRELRAGAARRAGDADALRLHALLVVKRVRLVGERRRPEQLGRGGGGRIARLAGHEGDGEEAEPDAHASVPCTPRAGSAIDDRSGVERRSGRGHELAENRPHRNSSGMGWGPGMMPAMSGSTPGALVTRGLGWSRRSFFSSDLSRCLSSRARSFCRF